MSATGVQRLGWSRGGDTLIERAVAYLRLVSRRARQSACGLAGHDMVLHFEPARLSLECLKCGARTPGWTLDVKPRFGRRLHVIPRGASRASRRAAAA